METYKNLKKSTKIGLIILAVLLVVLLVNNISIVVKAFNAGRTGIAVVAIIDIVVCVIIMLYAFFGYKKPHGNLLKLVFFVYAISLALQGALDIAGKSHYITGDLFVLAALLIAYVAGRLNKIEKNKFILIFVGLLILASVIIGYLNLPPFIGFSDIFGSMTPIIIFAALSFAYTARYEEHKAAGLADKADAKEN